MNLRTLLAKNTGITNTSQLGNVAFYRVVVFCGLFSCLLCTAQEKKWSVEGNFPYTFGDNFVDEGYNGVADAGLKYRVAALSSFEVGASLNVGVFLRDDSRFNAGGEVNGNALLFQPRLFASYFLKSIPELHPMVGLGYAIFLFNVNEENFNNANFQQSRSDDGVNLNFALAYDIGESLLLQLQYDYIRLSARNSIDSPYNKNVNIIKLGFGYRF